MLNLFKKYFKNHNKKNLLMCCIICLLTTFLIIFTLNIATLILTTLFSNNTLQNIHNPKISPLFSIYSTLILILNIILITLLLKTIKQMSVLNTNLNLYCGLGYDVHKLEKNKNLILCGVLINHNKGLVSFSDGDVATHALIDSLLGASAQFDIGTHFPDNNTQYQNINSLTLLQQTNNFIHSKNFKINNIDITIVAQKPKLKPFINQMQSKLATTLNISKNIINIKATTEENLGFTGQELGISAFCISTLKKYTN